MVLSDQLWLSNMGAMKDILIEAQGLDDQFLIDQYNFYDGIINGDDEDIYIMNYQKIYFQALAQEMYYRGYLQPIEVHNATT